MTPGTPKRRPRDYFYGEVLGLRPGMRHPDHYTLLGLNFFEHDHDTILRAALARLRLLEACQADPRPAYRKIADEILAEVREAQLTLLDPRRRESYDAALIGPAGESGKDAEPEPEPEPPLPAGTMFAGRYRILREVRRGALGIVYEALDSNLRSRVHLSVLGERLGREKETRRRIERAARAAAACEHPNLVRIDEVGEADGRLFVRSRAFEGRNLIECIEASPHRRFEAGEAVRVTRAVARLLAHVHDRGAAHGDLRCPNVFVETRGRVLVTDLAVSRAVADASGSPAPASREPENDPTAAGDVFSLGFLSWRILAGEPPFPEGSTALRELPEDAPAQLAALLPRMLARDPRARPTAAEAVHALEPGRRRPAVARWIAAAAVLAVVVFLVAWVAGRDGTEPKRGATVKERAWQWIAKKRYAEAIALLRRARAAHPADDSLDIPLASALESLADVRERQSDPWEAQKLREEVMRVEPSPERRSALERTRGRARAALDGVKVEAEAVTAKPVVRVHAGRVPLVRFTLDGHPARVEPGAAAFDVPLDLAEGAHDIAWELADSAGNVRLGRLAVVVDTTAPRLEVLEPEDGHLQREGVVDVRVRVEDANPADKVRIRGRAVPLHDGLAADRLRLGDGEHLIEVVAADRAGHEARATRRVVVDSRAPELRLERARLVTRDGRVVVRGRVQGRVARVLVDGSEAELAADGSFACALAIAEDRLVPVVVKGRTGLERRTSVRVVVDAEPPRVGWAWPRRGRDGELLYGTREMEAGALKVDLEVSDETAVALEPEEGRVSDAVWSLPAHEGRRTVNLVARDEAGNEAVFELALDGHRARPKLEVRCDAPGVTNAGALSLEVAEASGELFVRDRPAEPGRFKLPLAEGRQEIVVRAVDRWGNETRWAKTVVADRTPPVVRLLGEPERGIGRQELVLEADEALATVRCVGKTFPVNARTARITVDLQTGRKKLHVVAHDLAGNEARFSFPLRVRNAVLELDGKSAVVVGGGPIPALDRFTIECWVRGEPPLREATVAGDFRNAGLALVWRSKGNDVPLAVVQLRGAGRLEIPVRKNWRWSEWTHLALSYDKRKLRLFVNGSLQGALEATDDLVRSKGEFVIGAAAGSRGPHSFFRGAIDELRVSDVARYVRAFRPARFCREDEHTVLLLRFDVREQEGFPDSSGHARHGRAFGKPVLREEAR